MLQIFRFSNSRWITLLLVGSVIVTLGNWTSPAHAGDSTADANNRDANEWIALFDGKSLNGWTTDEGEPIKHGWAVKDGMLVRTGRGGYMVTSDSYGDFELVFEWKNGAGANSGVKYRVKDYGDYNLGCEFQIIDDEGYKNAIAPWQRTGSLYAVCARPLETKSKPTGEWNVGRIVAQGPRLRHWLNGELTVDADTSTDDWKRRVLSSKFIEHPDFGQNANGPIMIQDHGGDITFRKIALRELAPDEKLAE